MYSLDQIFSEAIDLKTHTVVSQMSEVVSVIRLGVKIKKFKNKIEIINMGKGGSYYKECDETEYKLFKEHGWSEGCIHLVIGNCLYKLGLIEERIKTEVNTRKNDKHIKRLKNKRDAILFKYASYKLKVNQ